MSRENKVFAIAFPIWLLGIVPLYFAWNFHFPNDLLDTVWGFALYIVAFGYFIVLMPLMNLVRRYIFPEKDAD